MLDIKCFKLKHNKWVAQATISLTSTFLTILCAEMIFYLYPQLIHKGILLHMSSNRLARAYGNNPAELVERLGESPWIKFKPGVTVKRWVRPHEVSTFVNEWTTDRYGFNNDLSLLDNKAVRMVVLGDSHVEGIGVAKNEHFAGVLTSRYDVPTLNLGVQGYSPQQMMGVYKKIGPTFSPSYVIFCFNGNLFSRSLLYEKGNYTGGISSHIPLDEHRISSGVITESFFLSGLKACLAKIFPEEKIKDKKDNIPNKQGANEKKTEKLIIPPSDIVSREEFQRYIKGNLSAYFSREYLDLSDAQVQSDVNSAMRITKKVISDFDRLAREHNAIPIVFVMPTMRYLVEIAYPETYKEMIKGTFIGMEYWANEEILSFCRQNGISVIDGIAPMRDYMKKQFVENKEELVDFKLLPFFKIDGHPSQVAHNLYASAIFTWLKQIPHNSSREE